MRSGSGGCRGLLAGLTALLLALSAACAEPATDPTELPTFPAASETVTAAAGSDDGVVPDDCERILKVADLNALLGRPLDTVVVRTTIGIAEPSVGRTERVACRYSGVGEPTRGRRLLDINAAAYTGADAAASQWSLNADEEDGARRDLPIGSAGAVVVERGGEALLSVVYGTVTLTMVLPDQPLPGGRSRVEALIDLALRVLPAVVPPRVAPAPTSGTAVSPVAGAQ